MNAPDRFAPLPAPPYYAVIFAAQRTDGDNGYAETAARMEELAATMPGFLGIESARDKDGFGITVSYWGSQEAIRNWKANAEHAQAQRRGIKEWYAGFTLRVARIERAYGKQKTRSE
ncbi:MAG: antibiotic biosynthesis monooxygenase family protein [Parvularculaceae bacterium]